MAGLAVVAYGVARVLSMITVPPAVMAYEASVQCRVLAYGVTVKTGIHLPGTPCSPLQDLGQWLYRTVPADFTSEAPPAYPLKVSTNGRYLVDKNDTPVLIVGDSPQGMIGDLSVDEARHYLANRQRAGFNSVWLNLLCNDYTGCNENGSTRDAIPPFTIVGDLSTPNESYFDRADTIISIAAEYGINVLLDPIETGGWLRVLERNGPVSAYEYGKYVGERYKRFPNIVWLSGNDFQSWQNPDDDQLVLAVARGIHDADPQHLQTIELNFLQSSSSDDENWADLVGIDSAYTYYPTYAEVLKDYNRPVVKPVIMHEASYEFEEFYTGPQTLRRQEYWAILSGAAGQYYGNKDTWPFKNGWQHRLDTIGSVELGYVRRLFTQLPWYTLVPDQAHSVVTVGFGTPSTDDVNESDYVTAARTPDGTLIVAYLPVHHVVTIDMSQLSGVGRASWYDPTQGTFRGIANGLPNGGVREFEPPGKNGDGDDDWVLLLESARS